MKPLISFLFYYSYFSRNSTKYNNDIINVSQRKNQRNHYLHWFHDTCYTYVCIIHPHFKENTVKFQTLWNEFYELENSLLHWLYLYVTEKARILNHFRIHNSFYNFYSRKKNSLFFSRNTKKILINGYQLLMHIRRKFILYSRMHMFSFDHILCSVTYNAW